VKLYHFHRSGNCYKIRLLLSLLDAPCELVDMDLASGATRRAEFLAMNPSGRVPLLEIAPGRLLPESNAILCCLAEGSSFLPEDRYDRAQTLRWLFFEQNLHEPYVALARVRMRAANPDPAMMANLHQRGYDALDAMARHLTDRDFFAAGSPTIADIALYPYTNLAPEGGFDLARYPTVCAWLERVAALPRFIPLD